MKYDKQEFYEDVCTFNRIAGKDFSTSKEDLLRQVLLIQEELNETRHAIEQDNPVEILDGAIDVAVTLFGLMQQLENSGYDVDVASLVTANNNLLKFVASKELAEQTAEHLRAKEKGMTFRVEEYESASGKLYVIKDQFDKVRKPIGYVKNNLAAFVPSNNGYVG